MSMEYSRELFDRTEAALDKNKAKQGIFGEKNTETAASEAQERVISPEELRGNIEMLNRNMEEFDRIPESVLQSEGGQEATRSFGEKVKERLNNFRQGVTDKFNSFDSWSGKDKVVSALLGMTAAAVLFPALIQLARARWPEVGIFLHNIDINDPFHHIQEFIHLDLFSSLGEYLINTPLHRYGMALRDSPLFGGGEWMNNLLADIASGKEPISSLSASQMNDLVTYLDGFDVDIITNVSRWAEKDVGVVNLGQMDTARAIVDMRVIGTTLENIGVVALGGLGINKVYNKIKSVLNKNPTTNE